jgi:hypothetical protein
MGYRSRQGDGPPGWFVFLLGVAFIFGGYYLWNNFQEYLRVGGLSVSQATTVSLQQASATAVRQVTVIAELPTRRPTATPKPACQDFSVIANTALMRQAPSTRSKTIEVLSEGTVVCVLEGLNGDDAFVWYLIDRDPITQLIETAYMREDVIHPLNPTPTPSHTPLPAPSITATFTDTPGATPNPSIITPAPVQTLAPSITPEPVQN